MVDSPELVEFANKLHDLEAAQSEDHGVEYGREAWLVVLRQLTPHEFTEFQANANMPFTDRPGGALWDRISELLQVWEEWAYGDYAERMAAECCHRTSLQNPEVWQEILGVVNLTREDLTFLGKLLDNGSEDVKFTFLGGTSWPELEQDPEYKALQEIADGYDFENLYYRIDEAYEAHGES